MERYIRFSIVVVLLHFFTGTSTAQYTFLANKVLQKGQDHQLDRYFHHYQIYHLDVAAIQAKLMEPMADGRINLSLGDDYEWQMELNPYEFRHSDFRLRSLTTAGERVLPNIPTPTYVGNVKGGGKARLTTHNDYFALQIVLNQTSYYIESAQRFDPRMPDSAFVVYEEKDVLEAAPGSCGAKASTSQKLEPTASLYSTGDCYDTKIGIATDYSMVADLGSVDNVLMHALHVMSLVAGDWEGSDFNDDIRFSITELLVVECPTCDPWSEETEAGLLLEEFKVWATTGGFNGEHDLGQLWTNRNICILEDCATIGLATSSSICTSSPYHLLENAPDTDATRRSLASHEIGHNFDLIHNYEIGDGCDLGGRSPLIMDPINQGATNWSDGTQTCNQNNVARLSNFLATLDCIDDCTASPNNCPDLTGLELVTVTDNSVTASWDANSAAEYEVSLRDVTNDAILETVSTTETTVTFDAAGMEKCRAYQLLVRSQCANGAFSAYSGAIFETDHRTDFDILETLVANCDSDNGTYDLRLVIAHGGGNGDGFRFVIDGVISDLYDFTSSPQTIQINDLTADGNRKTVEIFPETGGGADCSDVFGFTAPAADCSLSILEDFDTGLPPDWEVTTSTPNLSYEYEWRCGGENRLIASYNTFFGADPNSAHITATIDSTDMLYFDDDVIATSNFTGLTFVTSHEVDMRAFDNVVLEFDYMFHRFDGGEAGMFGKALDEVSYFSVEAFDGASWNEIFRVDENDCTWFNRWKNNCISFASLPLTGYSINDFKIRFVYSDGLTGLWGGMVAIDNLTISGTFSAPVPLPVTLEHFSGKKVKTTAVLDWATTSEENNDFFTLERSANGRDFEPIATINGNGSSLTTIDYQCIDKHPLIGDNYYRLKQTDFDGRSEYVGNIVVLNFESSGNDFTIRPNPVTNHEFQVLVDMPLTETTYLTMHNATGQIVRQLVINAENSSGAIHTRGLANGVYFINIKNGDTSVTKKLIIAGH